MFEFSVIGDSGNTAYSMETIKPVFDPNPQPLTTAIYAKGGADEFRHGFNNPEAYYTPNAAFGGSGRDTYSVYLEEYPDAAVFSRIASDVVFKGGNGSDTMLFSIRPNDVNGPLQAVDLTLSDFRPNLTSVETIRFEIATTGKSDGGPIVHRIIGSSQDEDLLFLGQLVPATGGSADVSVNLNLGGGADTIEAWVGYLGVNVDSFGAKIKGGKGRDTIKTEGNQSVEDNDKAADVVISGGAGRDKIYGSAELREKILGGSGNDVIYLDAGTDAPKFNDSSYRNIDIVFGGSGSDTFVVTNPEFAFIFNHQVARIRDFSEDDWIAFGELDGLSESDLGTEKLSYDQKTGVLSHDGFTLIKFDKGTVIENDQFLFGHETDLAFV